MNVSRLPPTRVRTPTFGWLNFIAAVFLVTPLLGAAAADKEIVLSDFEADSGGFPDLLVASSEKEKKVGNAAGRFRIGPMTRLKRTVNPKTAVIHKTIEGLNREITAVRFWAKSADFQSFKVHLMDGAAQPHTFEIREPGFRGDGEWHAITLPLSGQDVKGLETNGGRKAAGPWLSPLVQITFDLEKQNTEREESILWIDHLTATVGAELPEPGGPPLPVARRLLNRPLFEREGKNKAAYFASLIKVPDWLPPDKRADAEARYYLYWSIHKGGDSIHMSWAKELTGPYQEWNPQEGVLRNTQVGLPAGKRDFASPDVHCLEQDKKFRMYLHSDNSAYVAESADGLHWTGVGEPSGEFVKNESKYYRVWRKRDAWYAIDRGGALRRSADGVHFEKVKQLWGGPNTSPNPRHVGVFPNPANPDLLEIFVSRQPVQDEQIELTRLDMSDPDPARWRRTMGFTSILTPEMDYEGAQIPPSISVPSSEPAVRQLRDPYIYCEEGRIYLLYGIKGEQGFALAELTYPPQ